ncbi:hypothetical protein GCM10023322_07280 [Rugosimonospora acidiphila]|uniref:DUF4440 domain-containing protein n=1 Tax=Rugosimonospora acidiphila TaxID=556531 RepID=A0ABP9RKN3_9ACTN
MDSTASPSNGSAFVGDERAVRAVVDAVSQAWGDNDAAAFVDHYAEDATAIVPGLALLDRADIRTRMAEAFAAQLKGTRRIHQIRGVRFLDQATAIVTSRSGTAFPGQSAPSDDRWSLATWVLSRRTGRWLIEAYHDCPAA